MSYATEPEGKAAQTAPEGVKGGTRPGFVRRIADSDIWYSFTRSPLTMVSAVVTAIFMLAALFAPLIAPHNPFDPASISIMDSFYPPIWEADSDPRFLLGSDDQGRDVLSTILYGMRISLAVGFASVIFAMVIGVTLGLLAGYLGGWVDSVIMRIADVQLTFPAILIALLINGVARAMAGPQSYDNVVFAVLVLSIGLSFWVQYARTVRGSVLVEANKEYVLAAKLIGLKPITIMFKHVLPNVLGPVLVIATINLALAIITEATLSFLGVGVPPTEPSLGTLIRIGNDFLFSGEWWVTIFPGITLAILALAVNLLGDWLRDALNPKLR
ncbi:ABC transporter permease [Mesorhizobium xinjiangense]|uniref:ABC transporter permease n=1 Tax=Mesorhizobium xinjiangense TaxID=2678685 RepID=UPI0012EDC074|nr:ABC transporter permease [Mesorhizobium xinjiangense]